MSKKLYLSFDDGPSAKYTPELLEILAEQGIKATFFAVGRFAAENPEIIRRELSEGHEIGVHSNRHKSAYLMGRGEFERDMDASLETLRALGAKPRLYRAPWGRCKSYGREVAESRGLETVRWDVMAQDWRATISEKEIERRLLERVFDGAVICLHDGRGRFGAPARTIEALRSALPLLKERGYEFEKM